MLAVNSAFATPITLTEDGYELSQGIHDTSLAVSDNLTLFAFTRIGQSGYGDGVNGIEGGITVQSDGIGVKGVDLNDDGSFKKYGGSDPLSGIGAHQDEAIIFDYLTPVSLDTISLDIINTKWSKEKKDGSIESIAVNLEIKLNTEDPFVLLNDKMDWTQYGLNTEYGIAHLNFIDLFPAFTGTVADYKLTVTEGHLLINGIADAPFGPTPAPEPATMLLLGSGLIVLAGGFRKKFKK